MYAQRTVTIAAVTGVLLFMAACAQAPPDDPNASPPRIEFASGTLDFGVMPEIETRVGTFTFTNTGGRTLVIDDVSASCGCTVPKLAKRRYAPGDSGELIVEFDPSSSGPQIKRLSVASNSEPEPVAQLMVTADVTPFVDLDPKMLTVDEIVFGESNEFVVTATCLDESFVIESVEASNPHASVRVVEPAEGSTRTIVVTIEPTAPWGSFFSWIAVTSRARPAPNAKPVTHTRKLRVQGQVSGALTANPHTFRFGIKPGQRLMRTVRVWRKSGEPFALDEVTFETTGLEELDVRVEPAGDGAYELTLTARGSSSPRTSRGRVAFGTDVPGEERLEIPIVGVVRTQTRGVR